MSVERENERRASGRIQDSFPIEYRVITPAQFAELEPLYRTTPTEKREASPDAAAAQSDPVLLALLQDLHRKVDRLLSLTGGKGEGSVAEEKRAVSEGLEQATCVELSGTGLRMVGRRQCSLGTLLDLIIPRLGPDPLSIQILAKVVRESRPVASQHETVVTFVAINEEDREQLIAHLFRRQRQLLASRHGLE